MNTQTKTTTKVSAPDNAQITDQEVREIFNRASLEAYAESWRTRASEAEAQRDELLAAAKEARMALTLDYHGSTKSHKALCETSEAARQAHYCLNVAIRNTEGSSK